MTDTTELEATPGEAVDSEVSADLSELLMRLPAFRWLKIQRRYDMPVEDILENLIVMAVVANNERHRATTGRDDFERYEAMGLAELLAGLDIGDDATKSDAEPASPDSAV